MAIPPHGLGCPSDRAQSAYYPGDLSIGQEEIRVVTQALEAKSILPENRRIKKVCGTPNPTFEVLQASVDRDEHPTDLPSSDSGIKIRIQRGDHSDELAKINSSLAKAIEYAANDQQRLFMSHYIKSFQTGSLEPYRESQRVWVKDKGPRVENIFGFVEPYRDPYGVRAEFEGLVAITDIQETKNLTKLVEHTSTFIERLPWAGGDENDGKKPFEKALFEPPDFTSIHGRGSRLGRKRSV